MVNIEFIGKDQLWDEEQTQYWFSVNGKKFCIADTNGDLKLLDAEGSPIAECDDQEGVKELLISEHKKYIFDW